VLAFASDFSSPGTLPSPLGHCAAFSALDPQPVAATGSRLRNQLEYDPPWQRRLRNSHQLMLLCLLGLR